MSISRIAIVPRMSTEPVCILKIVKVLCFDTLLEVFILKGLRRHRNRAKWVLILNSLAARILREIGRSRPIFGEKKREEYNAETPRPGRGRRRPQRHRREAGNGAH